MEPPPSVILPSLSTFNVPPLPSQKVRLPQAQPILEKFQISATYKVPAGCYNGGMEQPSNNQDGRQIDRAEPLSALPVLLEQFRSRLRTLVELRIDRRIRARVDASDIIQEAFADAARRFPEYEQERKMSPYIWLRFLTLQQLVHAHRRHLGVHSRTAKLEQPQFHHEVGLESSAMAFCFAGGESTPSVKVSRAEEIAQLTAALDEMDPIDRELLALRHFEQLEHAEIGELLGLSASAVSSRYRRALKKIGSVIKNQNEIN